MGTETTEWYNQNILIGMTSKRGKAWHYKESSQGAEPNHYELAIPVEDVERRLFFWNAIELPMEYTTPNGDKMVVPNKKVIVRDDTFASLGVPSTKYQSHQYSEWLIKNVANFLDDDLVIGSAGLLKGGAVAWVQVEMPENMKVADVEFRPTLLATTSFNGSIATTYKRVVTIVVCDNTREMALDENGQTYRIRHTSKSLTRIAEARSALEIIHTMSDEFTKELETLLAIKVSDNQFDKFLTKFAPATGADGANKQTRADNVREQLKNLYISDERVSPWKGTGYGVLQAVNTYRQHERPIRGNTIAVERTMMETLKGKNAEADIHAMELLLQVTR